MKLSRVIRRRVIVLALLAIATALLWRSLPRERLLLERARRITSAGDPFDLLSAFHFTGNGHPEKEIVYDPYLWQSDKQVIVFHPTEKTLPTGPKIDYEANRIQIGSGAREPMEALSKALATDLDDTVFPPDDQQASAWMSLTTNAAISPDGQWILYGYSRTPSSSDIPSGSGYVALALDGSRRIVWPKKPNLNLLFSSWPPPLWLQDNRHWIQMVDDGKNDWVNIYDLDQPRVKQKVTVTGAYDRYFKPLSSKPLGITHDGEVLLGVQEVIQNTPSHSGWLIRFPLPAGLRSGQTILHGRAIPMPEDGSLPASEQCAALSPYGDRLAWLIIYEIRPYGPAWMQRILTFLGQHKHKVIGLWVSRLDGSHMHEIGHLPYQPDEEIPQQIRWAPGGKRLSFVYKGSLYTVPADE